MISPTEVEVGVEVFEDRIKARFSKSFMGLKELSADFNPETGVFETRERRLVHAGRDELALELDLEGRFVPGSVPPQLEFTARLGKSGDRPGWECDVEGRGTASRSDPG